MSFFFYRDELAVHASGNRPLAADCMLRGGNPGSNKVGRARDLMKVHPSIHASFLSLSVAPSVCLSVSSRSVLLLARSTHRRLTMTVAASDPVLHQTPRRPVGRPLITARRHVRQENTCCAQAVVAVRPEVTVNLATRQRRTQPACESTYVTC